MSANAETDNDPQNDAGKDAKGQKGNKKNKQKGKTMSLAAFNAQAGLADQHQVSNWADHVETVSSHRQTSQTASTWQPKQSSKFAEPDSAYDLDIDPIRSQLPTAPRAAREPVALDLSRIPENGPYKVHVGNLPFGVDEVAVANFFGTDEKQVHLIRESGRPKGFGFVELPSRDLLIAALEKNGELMANRAVKVALATAPTGSENDRHRNDRDDRSNRAWRSDAPREEVERNWRERRSDDRDTERRFDDRDRDRGERRFDDRDRDRGERRFDDRDRDRGDRRFDDRDRDRGDRRYDDRDRGGDRRYDDRERRYDGGRRFNDRRPYDDRDRDRRKFDDREEEPRTEESNWRRGLAQRKDEQDGVPESRNERDQDSRKDRSPQADSAVRRGGSPRDASPEHEKPRERPKLNLQPRTKPIDDGKQSAMSESARQAIFGAAKPVDTVSREREIEKRLDAEREKFDSAHELDDAVANRTRRRTISSSSNASQSHRQSRSEDAGPERERLNSAKVIEEDDRDRPQPARGERTWYRGGAPRGAGGRYDRGAPRDRDRRQGGQYPERNVPSGNDEYFYDDDYRSEQPQSDHPDGDDEASGYGRRGGQGGPRRRPDDRYAPRGGRGKVTDAATADEDGFQQVGAGGRAVLAVAATRPADYPGGKPTSAAAAQKRTDSGPVKKDEAPLKPASLIHKSKFSALASANFDEDVNASDDE